MRRWVDVILPMVLGGVLFALITYVIYAGNRRDQIAGRVERQLIRKSLSVMPWQASADSNITLISETNKDLSRFGVIDHPYLKGVDISVYAQVLMRLWEQEPKLVVVNWIPAVHGTEEAYLRPIVDAIAAAPGGTEVLVAYPIYEIDGLPETFRKRVQVMEGDDCGFELQIMCTFNREWGNWIVQAIAQRLWDQSNEGIPKHHVSENLPHVRQTYLLNLPDVDSLRSHSMAEIVLDHEALMHVRNGIVFVGSWVDQSFGYKADSTLVRRVRTAQVGMETPIELAIPFHVWLAQMATMFVERNTIAVAPKEVTWAMIALLCSCIFIFQWRLGTSASLGIFILYSTLYPFINDFLVSYFQIYLPMFDAIYVGLVVFLLAAFGRLSLQAHQRWLALEQKHRFQSDADIKTNFIAMISHNLNTPIAKMQGLIDLLVQRGSFDMSHALKSINRRLVRLQLAVRAVLITTAAEDRSLATQSFTAAQFFDELDAILTPFLRRLGLQIKFEMTTSEDDEAVLYEVFAADPRAVAFTVLGWLWRRMTSSSQGGLTLFMDVSRFDTQAKLVFTCTSQDGAQSPDIHTAVNAKANAPASDSSSDLFLLEIIGNLQRSVEAVYRPSFRNKDQSQREHSDSRLILCIDR